MLKDKDQPSHLGPYDQSLRNQFVSSPYRPALSSDKAGEDNSGGKRKPMHSPGHSASWVEYSEEPISSSKPTSRLKMLGAKGSEPGAKSTKTKKKNRDATGRKDDKKKKLFPLWKEVVANPFGPIMEGGTNPISLSSLDFFMMDFREFKAGGSMPLMAKASCLSANREGLNMVGGGAQTNQMKDSSMKVDESVISIEVTLNPCTVWHPLTEISNQQASDGKLIASAEIVLTNISNCPLKLVDPSLRSKRMGKDDEEIQSGEELPHDQMGTPEVPTDDMQFDE